MGTGGRMRAGVYSMYVSKFVTKSKRVRVVKPDRVAQAGGDVFCFFFSSRRRHTRLQGDWSSDVCSSDLVQIGVRNFESVPGQSAALDAVWTVRRTKDGKSETGRTSAREKVDDASFDAIAADRKSVV